MLLERKIIVSACLCKKSNNIRIMLWYDQYKFQSRQDNKNRNIFNKWVLYCQPLHIQ